MAATRTARNPQGAYVRSKHPGREEFASSALETYRLIPAQLTACLPVLARCRSTGEISEHPVYGSIRDTLAEVLSTCDTGDFTRKPAPPRSQYRLLAWNVERGIQFERQLEALRDHSYLKTCDVLLLTETDLGMARSGNHAVALELARELGMHYAFAPCYLNLSKGAGVEHEMDGKNRLGLHGNAILSRYPIRRVKAIPLKNGKDKMAGREKRLGRQVSLVGEIEFPNYSLTAVSVHLDAQSSQRHRHDQMRDVLNGLHADGPVVIGGDWNTMTYNSSRAVYAILGFWLRVFMGVDNVIRNHYLHPYNRFEKDLFRLLEAHGLDYRRCNRLGDRTASYDVEDPKTYKNLREWVPDWCFSFIRWALRNHGGKCPLKIDWFATRGLSSKNPVIIHELRERRAVPLSDHDPIGMDVVVPRD